MEGRAIDARTRDIVSTWKRSQSIARTRDIVPTRDELAVAGSTARTRDIVPTSEELAVAGSIRAP